MRASLKKKQEVVDNVASKFSNSVSVIATEYRGLTSPETTELRQKLREAGVELKVVKNTLVKRATAEAGIEGFDGYLSGPTALAFSNGDPLTPIGVLYSFSRSHECLKIKGGIMEGCIVDGRKLSKLSSIPSKKVMLSMLLSSMQGAVRSFVYLVKQIADKKAADEAKSE